MLGAVRFAQAQDFKLTIPAIPFPPKIIEYSSGAAAADTPVKIKAVIEPQLQKEVICPTSDNPWDCETEELQLADASPYLLPENPPPIVAARVFYYMNGDNEAQSSTDMTYNGVTGKWEGEIPGQPDGTEVTYYIVASDAVGNVAAMARYLDGGPSYPNWDVTGATPDFDNCSPADYHLVCSKVEEEALNCKTSGCNAADGAKYCYTVKDPYGGDGSSFDTCGQPDDDGNQTLQPGLGKTDMKGLSVWSDDTWLNFKLGLVGPIPTAADSPPIEAYVFLILNPDIPDPNPNDMEFKNGFAITYAPEAQGTDPTLVKVLWEADCLFTSGDSLGCKLLTGITGNDFKIGQDPDDGALRVEVRHIGSMYRDAKSDGLIGNASNNVIVVALAGNIDIVGASGAMNDQLPGFSYYAEQGSYTITGPVRPSPVDIISTTCDGQNKVCAKSATQPSKNTCAIKFNMVESFTNHYEVFRSTDPTSQGDQIGSDIAHVAEGTQYTFSDDITKLDGTTYYYQIFAMGNPDPPTHPDGMRSAASKTQCTVEDWVRPDISTAVQNVSCEGVEGFDGVVELNWNSDTVADPSLSGFYIQREGERLNFTSPLSAISRDTTYRYSYLDNGSDLDGGHLDVGADVQYTITAFDRGGQNATTSAISCRPCDCQSPENVDTLFYSLICGELGVSLRWDEPDSDVERNEDIVGYNVYRCADEQKNVTCRDEVDGTGDPLWTKLNSEPVVGDLYYEDTDFETEDENVRFCYWVRPIDAAGNEPKLPVDAIRWDEAVACLSTVKEIDIDRPSPPTNVAALDAKKGHTVELSWTGTTSSEYGPFVDPERPEPFELIGYFVYAGPKNRIPYPPVEPLKRMTDLSPYNPILHPNDQFEYAIELSTDANGNSLENNIELCFQVYSVDAGCSLTSSASAEVCATLTDKVAPSAPALSEMECDDAECVMTWESPDDWDALTFDMHRCTGSSDSCTSAASFSKINESEIFEEITKIQTYTDDSGDPQQPYTYCVVANDPAGNASGVAAALASGRCKVGGVGLGPNCPTVVQVSGTENDSESGLPTNAALCWNASSSSTVAGYNIYACPSTNGLMGCTKMNSSLETSAPGKNCTIPVSTDVVEEFGSTLYYTVLAMDGDGIECLADTAAFDGPIDVHPGYGCGEDGILITLPVKVQEDHCWNPPDWGFDPQEFSIGKKLKVCHDGRNAAVNGDVSLTLATFEDDSFEIDVCLLKCVSGGDCSAEGEIDSDCAASSNLDFYVTGLDGTGYAHDKRGVQRILTVPWPPGPIIWPAVYPPPYEEPQVRLRAFSNMGDATCDGKITILDFGRLREHYGNRVYSTCDDSNGACDGADFNRDGKVNILDFGLFRANYGYRN